MATPTASEVAALFSQCERGLVGHGPRRKARVWLAALAAEAGDDEMPDAYGRGDAIESLEREVAALLGKPAAVFMPSGTMAQQIALRVWSERSGRRAVAYHPTSHLDLHEQRGLERLHGLSPCLAGDARRPLVCADLEAVRDPVAALVIELPQRELGGVLPAWEDLEAQCAWARGRGAAAHMDGARLWECGPAYAMPYAAIAAPFDSVYVSFYKGLGGVAGAALAGPEDFVAEARVWQRRQGGNLVQLFPYVVAARAGLREKLGRFASYRDRAVALARALSAVPGVSVKPDPPQVNMMHVYLRGDAARMTAASLDVARRDRVALFRELRPTDVPGVHAFELYVGDGAAALGDEEVAAYFRAVVAAGAGQGASGSG